MEESEIREWVKVREDYETILKGAAEERAKIARLIEEGQLGPDKLVELEAVDQKCADVEARCHRGLARIPL